MVCSLTILSPHTIQRKCVRPIVTVLLLAKIRILVTVNPTHIFTPQASDYVRRAGVGALMAIELTNIRDFSRILGVVGIVGAQLLAARILSCDVTVVLGLRPFKRMLRHRPQLIGDCGRRVGNDNPVRLLR